jgi:uncharacterized protein (TIGR03382 family)
MLGISSQLNGVTAEFPKYLGVVGTVRAREDTFALVLAGNALVEPLVAADQRSNGDLAKLYSETRELTARRWADALVLYGSLAVAAWVEARRPQLPGMAAGCNPDAPTQPLVFKGFPLGSTPDAGMVPDAGEEPDSGTRTEPDSGTPIDPEPRPRGCGCAGLNGVAFLPFALLGLARVARRSRPRA